MKVVFVSNYFNHHQKPFCEEMHRKFGNDFTFISTTVMREERKKLGYAQDDFPEYVYPAYEGEQHRKRAISLINDADVVIAGSSPNNMFFERIRQGKLLFRYVERPFKKDVSFLKKFYHSIRIRQRDLWKNNIYVLCASAYAANDYASMGLYKNRTYKWGYFPCVTKYDVDELISKKKRNTLLWCGRFIDWKHPDDAIMLAKKLKENGYDFCLNMVGTGAMEDELHQLVEKLNLTDCVHFLGSMPPEQVRGYMEEAGIYLFTSDRQEGWGAVLNESMNSCCAVVASNEIGSVPFLIRDGENGLIYSSGNIDMLFEKVKYLLENPDEQIRLGSLAYGKISNEWCAEIAAKRFADFAEQILNSEKFSNLYVSGPCSKEETFYDDLLKL